MASNRSNTSQRQYVEISTPLQENSGYVVPKYDFDQPEEEEKPPDIDLVTFETYIIVCLPCPISRAREIKMACLGLCEGVHAAERQMTTQIPPEYCILVVSIGVKIYPFSENEQT